MSIIWAWSTTPQLGSDEFIRIGPWENEHVLCELHEVLSDFPFVF